MNAPLTEPAETGLCCSPILDSALDEASATQLAILLKALADPVRLRLVSLISAAPGNELCACDLPALVDRSQPTVSHHLSQLVKAGLVEREQRGKWAWFRVRPEGLAQVTDALSPEADLNLRTSPPIGQQT
jgi:ArsR family transcriptional regulator